MNDELELKRISGILNSSLCQLADIRDRGKPELQSVIEKLGSTVSVLNNLEVDANNKYKCTGELCEFYYMKKCAFNYDKDNCLLIREELREDI